MQASTNYNDIRRLVFFMLVFLSTLDISEQFCTFGISRCHEHLTSPQTFFMNTKHNLSADDNKNNVPKPSPPRKKKKKIVFNQNLIGVENVSSDGLLTEQKKEQQKAQKAREESAVKSNLGVPSKKKMKDSSSKSQTKKKLSKKAQKIADQRTANGTIDGTLQAGLALPEDQQIQIQEMKRGNKQVTIVRGFLCSMDERKSILKELKKKIGGGGSLIEGVIELQGNHADAVLSNLKSKGYVQAKKK